MPARRGPRQVLAFATLLACCSRSLQIAFFGLLIAAQAVPDGQIVEHLAQDIDDDVFGPTGRPDEMGGIAASHSECVMAGTGLAGPTIALSSVPPPPRISSCANGDEDIEALRAGRTVDTVDRLLPLLGRVHDPHAAGARTVGPGRGPHAVRGLASPSPRRSGRRPLPVLDLPAYVAALALPLLFASIILTTPSSAFGFALSYAAAFLSVTLTACSGRDAASVTPCSGPWSAQRCSTI